MTRLAVVFVLALVVIGCAPKEVPVTGEVFVVTRGGNSIKLGLVPVEVFTEAEANAFLTKYKAEHEKLVSSMEPQIQAAHAESVAAKGPYDEATVQFNLHNDELMKIHKNPRHSPSQWLNYYGGPYKKASAAHDAAEKAYSVAVAKERALTKQAMKLDNGAEMAKATPSTTVRTKTNGDGKFDFKLLPGKYGMWAQATRLVGGDTGEEKYFWFVWVNVEKDKPVHIMLSNDNKTDGICGPGSCVVDIGTLRSPKDGSEKAKQAIPSDATSK